MTAMLIILIFVASLSPLLTCARLWQIKEWRWDRFREHLRHEGWGRQLFGTTRPIIVVFSMAVSFLVPRSSFLVTTSALAILAGGTITQILLKKQHHPVWTKKVIVLTTTSLFLTVLVSYGMLVTEYRTFLPLLVIGQPLLLALSLLLWKPMDWLLKRRIMQKTKRLREYYPHLTVIGITGSVGKTTTKELLAHLLHDRNVVASPKHVNTELGIAMWLCHALSTLNSQLSTVIVEIGAYRTGEIRALCNIVQPTIGIVTWIGTQHVGLFGSQKHIVDAKGELFEALPKEGHAFLPANTPFLDSLRKKAACPVHVISLNTIPHTPNMEGAHHRHNLELAVAVARHLHVTEEEITRRLASFRLPEHTFAVSKKNNVIVLDDTHNVSPESMRAACAWATSMPSSHKVLFTPGIIEQGEREDRIHATLGKETSDIFDRVIFTDARNAAAFERGFRRSVERFSEKTKPVLSGSLLCCIGRVPPHFVHHMLPKS